MSSILLFVAFFCEVILLGDIVGYIQKHKSFNEYTQKIYIVAFICSILSAVLSYNTFIPRGIHQIQTVVTTHYGDESEEDSVALVDFDIFYEQEEGLQFQPKTIHWPDGSYSILSLDEYNSFGSIVTEYDENSSYLYYEIAIPARSAIHFTTIEKLTGIPLSDYLIYIAFFIIPVVSFFLYRKWNAEMEKEKLDRHMHSIVRSWDNIASNFPYPPLKPVIKQASPLIQDDMLYIVVSDSLSYERVTSYASDARIFLNESISNNAYLSESDIPEYKFAYFKNNVLIS